MLAYLDSYDHYGTAQIGLKYTDQNSAAIASGGRNANCLSLFDSNSFVSITLYPATGWTVGFGLKWTSGTGGGWRTQAAFSNSVVLQTLCGVDVQSDGTMSLYTNSGSIGTTGSPVMRSGEWDYYECQVVFTSGTDGFGNPEIMVSATLRMNGIEILSASGGTGLNPSLTLFNQAASSVHGLTNATGAGLYFDDFYVRDNQGGSGVNSFAGAFYKGIFLLNLGCIYMISDVTLEWTPLTGSSGYAMVNSHTPLGDLSYIDASVLNAVSTFKASAPTPSTAQILGAQIVMYARNDNEGTRALVALLNGTQLTNNPLYLNDSYVYGTVPLDALPDSTPFTSLNIGTAVWGVQIVE